MKFANIQPIISVLSSANITSSAIDLSQVFKLSAQIVAGTGTITGSLQLQVSNDIIPTFYAFAQAPIVNWSNLGSAVALSASGVSLIAVQDVCYRSLRVVFTDGSTGTGTSRLTVNLMMQEV